MLRFVTHSERQVLVISSLTIALNLGYFRFIHSMPYHVLTGVEYLLMVSVHVHSWALVLHVNTRRAEIMQSWISQ